MIRYIFDGYNMIKSGTAGLFVEGPLQKQREFLLNALNGFLADAKGPVKLTVIFDGPESVPFFTENASESSYGSIQVFFSEGKTADQRIEELVLQSGRPGDAVVVTNDKGIRRLLGATGARFMGVAEFAKKLFPADTPGTAGGEILKDTAAVEEIDEELKKLWLKQK